MDTADTPGPLPDALREHLERLKAAMAARVRAELRRLRGSDEKRLPGGGEAPRRIPSG